MEETTQNYTEYYIRGELALEIAKMYNVEKAYLKKNSPSCGKGGVTRILFEKIELRFIKQFGSVAELKLLRNLPFGRHNTG